MSSFADFSNLLCDCWNIPRLVPADNSIANPIMTYKLPASIEDIPALPVNCKESSWDGFANRIWIQTDNLGIEQILAGRAKLELPELRPLFIRVARILWEMLLAGWKPRTDISDIVEWDRREFNTIADHAANMALDLGQEWVRKDPEAIHEAKRCYGHVNFRICFDGARRGNAEASGGLAVFAYYPTGRRDLLLRAGKPFGKLPSAFMAESLAMEWCLQTFRVL